MDINLTLIAQAITFALFIAFTVKFVWPFLMRKVEERQATIAEGLAAAERGVQSLQDASTKSEEALKQARGQAQEVLTSAGRQANQLIEQAKGTAKTEAERIIAAAHDETQRELNQAREILRKQVGELAVAGAAQILKREIDAKAHGDVLKELAAKI